MFCPEGYKTIQEVRNSVVSFSWSKNQAKNRTRSDVFEALVFDTILDNEALRICSPQGVVMKVSEEILDQISILDFIEAKYFPFKHFHGLLEFEGTEKRWTGMPLFFERDYYTISLKSYREYKNVALTLFEEDELWDALALPFELDAMWQLVESIESYALCAVESLIPSSIGKPSNQERNYISERRGRPSYRPKIKKFYQSSFPNGHASWKQVLNAWIEEAGLDLSLDTIKRAVKELQGKNRGQK